MAKKTEEPSKINEPNEAELNYQRLVGLFQAETDPVKRAELDKQCQDAFTEKLKSRGIS